MTPTQRAFLAATTVLIPVLLLGLQRRGLLRLCFSFPLYLFAVWLADLAWLLWPERTYNWGFFVAKQTVFAALKFAIAIELATLAFGRFPGAAATARRALLGGLLATAATFVFGEPISRPGLAGVALALQPRLANGTVLLLLIVWALVLWYHVPVHRLHRAIVRGLVPYMLVFGDGVTLQLLGRFGLDAWRGLSYLDAAAYVALLLYWTWEAWRRADDPGPGAAVEPLLAWRARL